MRSYICGIDIHLNGIEKIKALMHSPNIALVLFILLLQKQYYLVLCKESKHDKRATAYFSAEYSTFFLVTIHSQINKNAIATHRATICVVSSLQDVQK